jgi:hypothetical protein
MSLSFAKFGHDWMGMKEAYQVHHQKKRKTKYSSNKQTSKGATRLRLMAQDALALALALQARMLR